MGVAREDYLGVRCAGKSGRRLEDCTYDRFLFPPRLFGQMIYQAGRADGRLPMAGVIFLPGHARRPER